MSGGAQGEINTLQTTAQYSSRQIKAIVWAHSLLYAVSLHTCLRNRLCGSYRLSSHLDRSCAFAARDANHDYWGGGRKGDYIFDIGLRFICLGAFAAMVSINQARLPACLLHFCAPLVSKLTQ